MRPELLEIEKFPERVSPYDLQATVELCWEVANSHWRFTHLPFEGALEDYETIEALADRNFETACQAQFVFQFGLWRLQALFETMIGQAFPETARFGMMDKLKFLRNRRMLSDTVRAELVNWIRLRNLLSHNPPRTPTLSHQINKRDLEEYAEVLRRVIEGTTAAGAKGGA